MGYSATSAAFLPPATSSMRTHGWCGSKSVVLITKSFKRGEPDSGIISVTVAFLGESPNSKLMGWLGEEIDLIFDVISNLTSTLRPYGTSFTYSCDLGFVNLGVGSRPFGA